MRYRRGRLMGFTSAVLLASVVAVAAPANAAAQVHGGHVHGEEEERYIDEGDLVHRDFRRSMVKLGGGIGMVVPQGDFGRIVGRNGFGGNFHAVFGLEPSNTLAIRFDGGFVNYGSERYTLVGPCCGPVGPNIRTTNNIGTFGVGPQLQLSSGPIRPYVNGYVGMSYFWTQSTADDGWYEFARTLNYDDWALGYGGGGGVAVQLGRGSNLMLNFDAQYRRHDNVNYLREGSILDDGFGGVVIEPFVSNVDFFTLQMGLSVGL